MSYQLLLKTAAASLPRAFLGRKRGDKARAWLHGAHRGNAGDQRRFTQEALATGWGRVRSKIHGSNREVATMIAGAGATWSS